MSNPNIKMVEEALEFTKFCLINADEIDYKNEVHRTISDCLIFVKVLLDKDIDIKTALGFVEQQLQDRKRELSDEE